MEFKSIAVALVLLAVLFGWYAWLEAGERRRRRDGNRRSPLSGKGEGGAQARTASYGGQDENNDRL